ncbi:ABC transporter substrate-binding protein, partial [Faecalicatena contorta]
MRKRVISIVCTAVLMAGLSAGCGQGRESKAENAAEVERDSVVVTMPATSEPEAGFDPAYGWGAGEHVHEPLIQSTLTVTTKDLKIEKDLAADYQVSEDGLTWTVTIRDDVKFTDGEPLTASDVAFTYNNCKEKSTVNDFTMLDRASALDDTTVEFRMTKPFSIWPYTMAIVGIVPEHAYDENYGQNPIGSGRYIMKQWDKGQQVIFEANPDYYGEAPKMKKVTVLFMEEDAALAAAMAGEADVAHTAASYSEQSVDGYELFAVQTVDNRGFNLPASEPEEKDGIPYG